MKLNCAPYHFFPITFAISALALSATASVRGEDVLTYHNNNARTGLNPSETILTAHNVNFAHFGLLYSDPADGKVDAEPLYVSNLNMPRAGTHNVLYVATEHDTVYAYDADTGKSLWQVTLLSEGEVPSDPRNSDQITPEIGVTSTPVIDRSAGPNGTIFVVAMSKDASGNYYQRLHALDLATGDETENGPVTVTATYPGLGPGSTNGQVSFAPGQYAERTALLLSKGVIYTAWTSHSDTPPYTGWMIAYDEKTLAQVSVINVDPNGAPVSSFLDDGSGNSFWMSGGGPAADASGNVYAISANGPFDPNLNAHGFPTNGDFGDSLLKFSTTGGLQVSDYFTPTNQQDDAAGDIDFGSGGVLLVPDLADASNHYRSLAVGAGKDSNLYLLDRTKMGKYNANANVIYQELDGALPGGVWSSPAYFDRHLYYVPLAAVSALLPSLRPGSERPPLH